MGIDQNERFVTSDSKAGTVLLVADFISDSQNILEFACNLAMKYDAHIELMHVIDPRHSYSNPDVDMGAQFNLETFAYKLRTLKTSVVSLMSFGCPEDVIPRRAAAIKANLIIFPLTGSETDRAKKGLINRLIRKCDCPVLAFPVATHARSDKESIEIHGFPSLIKKVRPAERKIMRKPIDQRPESGSMLRGA